MGYVDEVLVAEATISAMIMADKYWVIIFIVLL